MSEPNGRDGVGSGSELDPIFFTSPAGMREWLSGNHASAGDAWVGFYRKGTGRPTVTWPESVDEALCVGWIDGVRKTIDPERYKIRFSPRRKRSTWSAVNVERMRVLTEEGRMQPAGLAAYEARAPDRTGIYAYEQKGSASLPPEAEAAFRADADAWAFFEAQPRGYRQTSLWWIVSAKREETRSRRLAALIADSAHGRRLAGLSRETKP